MFGCSVCQHRSDSSSAALLALYAPSPERGLADRLRRQHADDRARREHGKDGVDHLVHADEVGREDGAPVVGRGVGEALQGGHGRRVQEQVDFSELAARLLGDTAAVVLVADVAPPSWHRLRPR